MDDTEMIIFVSSEASFQMGAWYIGANMNSDLVEFKHMEGLHYPQWSSHQSAVVSTGAMELCLEMAAANVYSALTHLMK